MATSYPIQVPFSLSLSYPSPNRTYPTPFGLPGNGGLKARYCDCEIWGDVLVREDETCRINLGWKYYASNINPNNYPSRNWISCNYFKISSSGGYPTVPSSIKYTASTTIYVGSNRYYYWEGYCMNYELGNKSQFETGGTDNKDAYIYVGGTGYYYVQNPTYPESYKITIPGLGEAINTPADYYPFAVYIDSDWMSCNRDGGKFQKYASNAWEDRKNLYVDSEDDQTCFDYESNKWTHLPEIGNK